MVRSIFIVLVVALLSQVETLNRSCAVSAQTGCSPCFRADPDPNKKVENKAPDVTDVAVDRNEVKLPPPKQGDPPKDPDYSSETMVNVITTASDAEGDTLAYNYTVSGGRIVGRGSNVGWDLNGVLPGTYTITAAVDDGCGLCGKTVTQTVEVQKDESAPACICSEISIDAMHMKIRTTGRMFVANLSGPRRTGLTYNWTVSNGEITSGQGSSAIRASRPTEGASPVTVTVDISGLDPACGCPVSSTKTFSN